MSLIQFTYEGRSYDIHCTGNELLRNICQRFINKSEINDSTSLFYLYNGNNLNLDLTLNELIGGNNNSQDIKILVNPCENSNPLNVYYRPKFIICPECEENARIKIQNFKSTIYGCKYRHITDISLEKFEETQKINLSNIICEKCRENNRGSTHENKFYRCTKCQINICPLCKVEHAKKKHKIIDYDDQYYQCDEHNEKFVEYCNDCNKDLCFICKNTHSNHKRESYLLPNMEEVQNKINLLKSEIDKFTNWISSIINKLMEIKKNSEIYFKIYEKIVDDFDENKRNYQILNNLNEINDNIINDFITINNENDFVEKIKKIFNPNTNTNRNTNINTNTNNKFEDIKIIYNIDEKCRELGNISLFGKNFVKANKENIKIEINGNEYNLMKQFAINDINEDTLEVKLKILNPVTDLSNMFYNCSSLLSLSNLSKINTSNIKAMDNMFNGCTSLNSLPDISEWNTSNVLKMENIFSHCSKLSYLPDISKWNTDSVEDMSFLFFKCSSLSSLPDISNWNVSKVKFMTDIFSECSSLKSLPDISKWKINNLQNMADMFNGCSSLLSLPDISKWNTSNVSNMSHLFTRCSSIKALPDISSWNTSNVNTMNSMFGNCSSLEYLPDLSNWKTSNVEDMNDMFNSCSSIVSIPDIKNWDTSKVKDMSFMFGGCNLLTSLPDISNWNTSNVDNMSFMFSGCGLLSLPDISRWNTKFNLDISCMFDGCPESLDIPQKFQSLNY